MDSLGASPARGRSRGNSFKAPSPSGAKSPLGCPRSVVRRKSPRTVQVT
jgi:hypothetical protein